VLDADQAAEVVAAARAALGAGVGA
jgi:hypothetical protein